MTLSKGEIPLQEPLWFGPPDRPLFGWLTRPTNAMARGGVVLAPPIGREAFSARHALCRLAEMLANAGFVTLRFDYAGTGDSSGNFEDPERDRVWVDGVADAAALLRSFGLESISAVGMRLGATLVGVAANLHDLHFSSVVLWDPCESGRSYLRELSALEALRREDFQVDSSGSVETSEFVFTQQAADELRRLSLSDPRSRAMAERVLVVAREDRLISEKFRARLEQESADWETTSEQGPLLDVPAYHAAMPYRTMERIAQWLSTSSSPGTTFAASCGNDSVVVAHEKNMCQVVERSEKLGPRQLFAMVSEPLTGAHGPWIVLLHSVNDDHTGRARQWVELSRRWAGFGLRCVRLDLVGYGESPWSTDQENRPLFDQAWLDDTIEAVRALSPQDPSNSVFIGLCSGAYVAVEAALSLRARSVCTINPSVLFDYLHGVSRLEKSRRRSLRALAVQLKKLPFKHQWVAATFAQMGQMVLPSKYSKDVLSKLVDGGTDLLVLASTDDLTPCPRTPLLRSIDIRRLGKSKSYEVEFIPGLDHGIHNADGRTRAMARIDKHVLGLFAGVPQGTDCGTLSPDES